VRHPLDQFVARLVQISRHRSLLLGFAYPSWVFFTMAIVLSLDAHAAVLPVL